MGKSVSIVRLNQSLGACPRFDTQTSPDSHLWETCGQSWTRKWWAPNFKYTTTQQWHFPLCHSTDPVLSVSLPSINLSRVVLMKIKLWAVQWPGKNQIKFLLCGRSTNTKEIRFYLFLYNSHTRLNICISFKRMENNFFANTFELKFSNAYLLNSAAVWAHCRQSYSSGQIFSKVSNPLKILSLLLKPPFSFPEYCDGNQTTDIFLEKWSTFEASNCVVAIVIYLALVVKPD